MPNREAVERGIAALDRLKKQGGDERRATAVDTFKPGELDCGFLSLVAGDDEIVLDQDQPLEEEGFLLMHGR